ncbi:MAG: response regulator [Anaerolineales bacterium]|nr:response regulator [Anaerolineales bacterium]
MAEKILIVDDDIDTLKLVGLMLERQGYSIAVASNGSLGLNKAAAERPDLILLDVMMPDMDGYEVTRRLRADPALAHIPIIMFTAKTMVDDKVAGFEAGVDDYLTKPTHPAELSAHVKAVLARSVQTQSTPVEKAKVLSFLGARGGVGTSTLSINISVVLKGLGQDVVLAEMNPGGGSMALSLGLAETPALSNLLTRSLKDIHLRSVESALTDHNTGIRVLMTSARPRETELDQAIPQMEAVVKNLSTICTLVVLDLGNGMRPHVVPLLNMSDRAVLMVEPVYPSTSLARNLLDDLQQSGINRHKISLALMTRERTSLQLPWQQVEAELGIELAGLVSPAPEQAHQADQNGTPLVLLHPNSLVGDQIRKLASRLATLLQLKEN